MSLLQDLPVQDIPIHQIPEWAETQKNYIRAGFHKIAAPRPVGIHVEESDVAVLSSAKPSSVDSPDLLGDLDLMQFDQKSERVGQWRTTESLHTQNRHDKPPRIGSTVVCSTPLEAADIIRTLFYEHGLPVYHTGNVMFGNRLLAEDLKHISSRMEGSVFYIDAGLWWHVNWLRVPFMTPYDLHPCLSLLIDHANIEVQLIPGGGKSGERTPPRFEINVKSPASIEKVDTIRPGFVDLLDTCKLITNHEVLYARPHNRRRTPLDSTHQDELARRLILEKLYQSAVIVLAKPWFSQGHVRQELLFDIQAWHIQQLYPTIGR